MAYQKNKLVNYVNLTPNRSKVVINSDVDK